MSAEQKIESCQEPQGSGESPRPVESSEPFRSSPQPSTNLSSIVGRRRINSHTIHQLHQLRSRLIRCLLSRVFPFSDLSSESVPDFDLRISDSDPCCPPLRARLVACLKSRVHEPDWQLLLQQTESFADIEIHYGYYWRERFGGVLPGGYDASSVAAEALAELFNEQPENGLILVPRMLRVDLKKRARKIINRLHHRMENRIMRNTPDLAPFLTHDGETISIVETVLAQDPSPLEILLEKEDSARFAEFKERIRALLAQEKVLLRLFECFCADICKPKDQARKLKLPVRHIQNLQRRLRRKLAAHGYVPSSWKSRIRANYFHSQLTWHQILAQAA